MVKQNKVVAMATTAAMTISVLAVLIGSGIGWGILQTRITALEARADILSEESNTCHIMKLEKEVYYKDQERFYLEVKELRSDLKELLKQLRKTSQR